MVKIAQIYIGPERNANVQLQLDDKSFYGFAFQLPEGELSEDDIIREIETRYDQINVPDQPALDMNKLRGREIKGKRVQDGTTINNSDRGGTTPNVTNPTRSV